MFTKNLVHLGLVALLAGCAQNGEGSPPTITDGIRNLDFEPPAEPTQLVDPTANAGTGGPPALGARIYTSGQTRGRGQPQGAVVSPDGAGVQLTFENADLREVVRTILGDVLQVSYTLDPAINGTVTLSTSAAMSRNDLLATLETVLRQNEAALVQEGNGYAVVQMRNAVGRSGVAQLGDSPQRIEPGYGITIIPLRHVPAITAQEFARPLIANPDDLRIDMQRNLLLVSGTAQERQTVVDTIADVDVDWLAGRSVGIFPLQATTPEAVIPELEAIFGVRGAAAAQDFTAYEGMRFIPMQRLNAVLVVSSDVEGVQRAREWVERLDAGNSVGTQLNIYQLRYTPAAAMATTLSAVIADGGGALVGAAPTPAPAAAVDSGQLADTGQAPPDIGLAEAAQLDFGGAAASIGSPDALRQVKIVPNEINNTLVIRATPDLYRMIEATARRLDTPPGQVVIDATIAEVTLNDRLRYGVQYFFDSGDFTFGFLNGQRGTGNTGPLTNGFPGFSFLFNSGNNQIIALDALSAVTDVRVMSAPTLVVQDNREATLNVGNEVPITIRSATADDDDSRTVNTIQYRETGVILTVKPRIGGNSTVSLEISQEVSSVVQSSTEEESTLTPTINQRKVQSVVSVRSGQTIVLGGLIQDTEQRSRQGIPLLSDIPAIGDLFANSNRTGGRTELLVFITPRVIRNAEDAGAIGREIRDRMRGITGGFTRTPIVPGPIERGTIRGLGGPDASLPPTAPGAAGRG